MVYIDKIINVGDRGFVEIVSCNADDLSVVNSARVSFGKRSEKMDEAGEGLIKFLMRERHGTPFEHNSFTFHIKCPIFVAREWFRHRIGSFNELSLRYAVPEIEFFLPELDELRTQVGKPGNYRFEKFIQTTDNYYQAIEWLEGVEMLYYNAEALYNEAIRIGIAREQARIVFPVALYTEFYWTINARSLMNFLSLRNDQAAQKEIRDFAEAIEKIFLDFMPITAQAFLDNNRVAV